jgi:hypothetical protein
MSEEMVENHEESHTTEHGSDSWAQTKWLILISISHHQEFVSRGGGGGKQDNLLTNLIWGC